MVLIKPLSIDRYTAWCSGARGVATRWRPDYGKRAAWVVCETGDMVGWFVVWTSGEAELEVGNLDSGVVDCVHYDLADPEELSVRLDGSPAG
ncbi:hypothetical protein GCM10027199_09100 [Amycolatopsis magusensis]